MYTILFFLVSYVHCSFFLIHVTLLVYDVQTDVFHGVYKHHALN